VGCSVPRTSRSSSKSKERKRAVAKMCPGGAPHGLAPS
jgi:hypothetical protein